MHIVYGGAFNPPTLAHFEIVNLLLSKFSNAKVIVLPVGKAYNKKHLISFEDRFNMLKLAFKENEKVIISDLENTNEFKGTINSLNILSKSYQNIYFVIGSDNIIDLDKWIEYEHLLTNYPLIIIRRNNDNVKKLMSKYAKLTINYQIIDFDSKISSSLIRTNINKYFNLLNQDVYQYIKDNNLYEVNNDV